MTNQQTTWGVWCGVSGGVTGRREGWLKADGKHVEFPTRDAAETEARRLLGRDGTRYGGGASFTYQARPYDGGREGW